MKKLGGVLSRCFGNPDATEHARNLFDPLLFFQPDNRAYRATVAHMLGHLPLLICARRNLRQMRHTHHLVASPQSTQHAANNLGDSATDPDVDLVEYERRNLRNFRCRCLNRERYSRQFSA